MSVGVVTHGIICLRNDQISLCLVVCGHDTRHFPTSTPSVSSKPTSGV